MRFTNTYCGPARIKPVSEKRRAQQEARDACRRAVERRAGRRCEAGVPGVCDRYAPLDVHERRARSQGGDPTDPGNCLLLCRACHDWAHFNVDETRQLGLILHRQDVADISPRDESSPVARPME